MTSKLNGGTEPEDKTYIRNVVQLSDQRFDTKTLPADMQRVYKSLAKVHGNEYALQVIFTIRTAVELHRAWHMSLLTAKIMQQLKDKFRLRLTWSLGVLKLHFRMSDGEAEISRKVPYDYDSEYQDTYMRIAVALMAGEINVEEALIYQSETQQGVHTARSGLFLRDFPGRIVLYPLVAATCAVIFFNGDWTDFGIAALCGFASGCVEFTLGKLGFGVLNDILVGTSTGIIGGLFYRYYDDDICLSSIFLGTLYWFFYGTAFVIGILEIIAGELDTGVTRFIAVSVKTFVLCLGAGFGLLVVGKAQDAWFDQAGFDQDGFYKEADDNCLGLLRTEKWWRIPLYLLCSVAVLGQYRFPIVRYWRALVTMLVGYEVQYQSFKYFAYLNDRDNLDTAISNVFACAAAVVSAVAVGYFLNQIRYYYDARILQPNSEETKTCIGNFIYKILACAVRVENMVGLGRRSDRERLDLEKKLAKAKQEMDDQTNARQTISLERKEENVILETIVGSQDLNIWSIMMPALYQLVPGSLIAKLWFNYIFPPGPNDEGANNVFSGLMIISTSLALGLVVGFALVRIIEKLMDIFCGKCTLFEDRTKSKEKLQRAKSLRHGMYTAPLSSDDNPESVAEEFRKAIIGGVSTEKEADEIFNAVDVDQSGSIDEGEVSYYMLKAGLTPDQVSKLFASMDKDGSGEVSREEFRRAVMDKANASLLTPKEEPVEESPVIDGDDIAESAVVAKNAEAAGEVSEHTA